VGVRWQRGHRSCITDSNNKEYWFIIGHRTSIERHGFVDHLQTASPEAVQPEHSRRGLRTHFVQLPQNTGTSALTQALEFLRVIFVLVSLVAVLYSYFHNGDANSAANLDLISMLFTILTMISIVFERLAVIDWIRAKKDYENRPISEIIYMVIEIVLLIPTPNSFISQGASFSTVDIYGNVIELTLEEVLAAYVTVRSVYFLRFLIHS
jgi:hypothetical protein